MVRRPPVLFTGYPASLIRTMQVIADAVRVPPDVLAAIRDAVGGKR